MSTPGHPVILTHQGGHDGTVEITEGATLELQCVTSGGRPAARGRQQRHRGGAPLGHRGWEHHHQGRQEQPSSHASRSPAVDRYKDTHRYEYYIYIFDYNYIVHLYHMEVKNYV